MDKIASPQELRHALSRILTYSQTAQPSRAKIAQDLRDLATELEGRAEVLLRAATKAAKEAKVAEAAWVRAKKEAEAAWRRVSRAMDKDA
ncbi:MAG: hypothetical protein HC897_15415 [Thermoanaerobaculia bacterium]|nr:hypothetical protein [Thermoanaerobaculia bacterium]